jgi:hypothetical protein
MYDFLAVVVLTSSFWCVCVCVCEKFAFVVVDCFGFGIIAECVQSILLVKSPAVAENDSFYVICSSAELLIMAVTTSPAHSNNNEFNLELITNIRTFFASEFSRDDSSVPSIRAHEYMRQACEQLHGVLTSLLIRMSASSATPLGMDDLKREYQRDNDRSPSATMAGSDELYCSYTLLFFVRLGFKGASVSQSVNQVDHYMYIYYIYVHCVICSSFLHYSPSIHTRHTTRHNPTI